MVDSNDPAEDVRKHVKKCIDGIMDKRAKGRCAKCVDIMKTFGQKCIFFNVPNATRVAGVHQMYQGLIKSRWNLNCLCKSTNPPSWVPQMTNEQFIEVAQMEALVSYDAGLSAVVQSDTWGSLAHCGIRCLRVHVIYHTKSVWDVAHVDKYNNLSNQWHASCKFPRRPLSPRTRVEQAVTLDMEEVQLIKVKTSDLQPTPQALIKRMMVESTKYCHAVVEPQVIALACHPLAATLGIQELKDLNKFLSAKTTPGIPLPNWKSKAVEALTKEVKAKLSAKLVDSDSSEEDATSALNEDAVDDEWKQVIEQEDANEPTQTKQARTCCPVKREVDSFFGQTIDWPEQLKTQRVDPSIIKAIGDNESMWQVNDELIAANFDVFEWWHREGRQKYKMIFVVACAILTLPASNGRQERTFSACTWMDTDLGTNQAAVTLEMKALLYENRKFIKQVQPHLYGEHKKMAAKATRSMLAIAEAHRAQTGTQPGDGDEDDMIADLLAAEEDDDASQLTAEHD